MWPTYLIIHISKIYSYDIKNCNWQTEKGRLEVFLELSQNSQENKYVSLFFSKVAGLRPATLLTHGIEILNW